MRMYDIIMKKRDGGVLSDEEIGFFVDGVVDGSIPDYQSSALLMAIYFRGLNAHETAVLTDRMAHSGDLVDLSAIHGFKADKHSTGGVGDKTTMIVGPIVASCGVSVAKMSGRGLGHTGGTVDKLESIPGFRVELSPEEFVRTVNEVGICVVGQSGNLAPADKKLYALRDVTATVDSIPLIAASIMSKKIAAGADGIVLDVKVGSGAFMKTLDDAVRLAETMVAIGEKVGRKTVALLTNMDAPLGRAVGNALEVREAVETLQGHGPAELTTICRALAANMLFLAGKGDLHHCDQLAREAVLTGAAFERFKMMVTAQAGIRRCLTIRKNFHRRGCCIGCVRRRAVTSPTLTPKSAVWLQRCSVPVARRRGTRLTMRRALPLPGSLASRWRRVLNSPGSTPQTRAGSPRRSVSSWRR